MNKQSIRERDGWGTTEAVRNGHVYEVKSTYILQPGPAALTEGIRQIHFLLTTVCGCAPNPALAPFEAMDPDLDGAASRTGCTATPAGEDTLETGDPQKTPHKDRTSSPGPNA